MATVDDEEWCKPNACSHFIRKIKDRQQCLPAISCISQYIERNGYQQTQFEDIESDVQSDESKIKQYLVETIANTQNADALFIDICALIEAVPITNCKLNMMAIQLTRITFNQFSMKHRQMCMKYIVESNFEGGIAGVFEDLLEYQPNENASFIIDYLMTDVCNTTQEGEQWLAFLTQAIAEHAYVFVTHINEQHNHIQSYAFQRLFMDARESLQVFEPSIRKQCAQYIVTKYDNPQEAKQSKRDDPQRFIEDLMSLRMNMNGNEMCRVIFCCERDVNDDLKQNEKLFADTEECYRFINALFHDFDQTTKRNPSIVSARVCAQRTVITWNEEECAALLKLCNEIKRIKVDAKWFDVSILMHAKLHPNTAFNLSAIDARDAVFGKIKNRNKPINTENFAKKFEKYLTKYRIDLRNSISDEDVQKLLEMKGPSHFVTIRYLPYIPVIVSLLNPDYKLNGCGAQTQRVMVEVSFRMSDVMIAFQLKDPDQIIHIDLVMIYKTQMMRQLKQILQKQKAQCIEYIIKEKDFYQTLFETISQHITQMPDANNCVVRIFVHFHEQGASLDPSILVQFGALTKSASTCTGRDCIRCKMNNRSDPIYLCHILYAFDRYQNLFPNHGDDDEEEEEKCMNQLSHLQYSLVILPQILDDESRVFTTKQMLCVREGILPFKRSDITELVPMMFKNNKETITKQRIKQKESEQDRKRKRFLYDKPFKDLEKKLNEV
eukprot:225492_1